MDNITVDGLCRGNGKVFMKVDLELSEADDHAVLACTTSDGRAVPCGLYPDGKHGTKATYVAVVPQVSMPLTLSFAEVDDEGSAPKPLGEKVLDPKSAKWRSRATYLFGKSLAKAIRDFDEDFAYQQAAITFERAMVAEGVFKVIGTVEVPCSEGDEVVLRCYDSDFREMPLRFIVTSEETTKLWEGRGPQMRKIGFSVDLPGGGTRNFIFTATVSGKAALDGFNALEMPICKQMAHEWSVNHVDAGGDKRYPDWLESHRATKAELRMQADTQIENGPFFSIVVPLYKTPLKLFDEMVLSMVEQTYRKWELLLVNASPEDERLQKRIDEAVASDERIREIRLAENKGISLNTRAGVEAARGDFVGFLDHDDVIEPDLLFEYALAITDDEGADLLYCDEDHIQLNGKHGNATFKPDFEPDLLRSVNYVCHLLCVRKSVLDKIEFPDASLDGAQDHDITLKVYETGAHIRHIPKVLYHWRMTKGSTALDPSAKPYAAVAGVRAITEHLERMGIPAEVDHGTIPFTYEVKFLVPDPAPLVSIVIPTKDESAVLTRCIESIEELTDYPNYEIVLVENNSTEDETFRTYERLQERYKNIKVVRYDGGFNFSKIVNFGVEHSKGDLVLLLNNDTEVINADWLTRMVGICCREDVGAVGARLWYPNDTLQHAGVALICGGAAHLCCGAPKGYEGYIALTSKMQDLSAVTGACLMVRRALFDEVGGFDEDFVVAFNDIDFCLRLRERGKLVVYDPKVELYHYESLSRGYEDSPEKKQRFLRETSLLRGRWPRYYVEGDPYYNKNLTYATSFYQLNA